MSFKSIGDFEFLVRAIVIAAFTSPFFATATMMIQSVRERRREIAVLKTVGFTNGTVFALTLAEAGLRRTSRVNLAVTIALAQRQTQTGKSHAEQTDRPGFWYW
jgi:putative ABC transport system permease protein